MLPLFEYNFKNKYSTNYTMAFGSCSEFSKFLLSAATKAGDNDFLMYINTTTTLIDSIHEITSWYILQRGSLT